MVSRVLVVHDEGAFREKAQAVLAGEGMVPLAVPDSMAALREIESSEAPSLLITRVKLPAGRPNGVALALMAQMRVPGLKVLFVASPDVAEHCLGIGEVMTAPVDFDRLAACAAGLMHHPRARSDATRERRTPFA